MVELSRRRGPFQHIFDILKCAKEPIKRTRLLSMTNIHTTTFFKYLALLVEKGLIEKTPYVWQIEGFAKGAKIDKRTSHLYVVTDKGRVLIELFERIYDILGLSESLTFRGEK